VRLFLHQLRAEQLVFWRSREAAVFVFLFPLVLFLLLGAVYEGEVEGRPVIDFLVAGLLGYGVANTTFGGLAISLVVRRELGILKRLRGTPLPPPTYLAAALASTLAVFALQSVALVALGRLVFGASLPQRPLSLAAALALGALAFAALGFAAASLIRSAEGSSAVVNLIVLPMSFLSGAFIPLQEYPGLLQDLSLALPLRHLLELLEAAVLDDRPLWREPVAISVLAAWGMAAIALAARRFGWEPRER
jgi:ABC-2 type transport system permease protein